ncbi:MAG: hypothetical protein ACYDGS_05760 [Thermoleophilia bacterium]
MKMYDCDVCMSAGSVNKWGYCEICGEDFEDTGSLVHWQTRSSDGKVLSRAGLASKKIVLDLAGIGRNAA